MSTLHKLVAGIAEPKIRKTNLLGFSTMRVVCAVVFIVAAFCFFFFGIHWQDNKAYAQRKACINKKVE